MRFAARDLEMPNASEMPATASTAMVASPIDAANAGLRRLQRQRRPKRPIGLASTGSPRK